MTNNDWKIMPNSVSLGVVRKTPLCDSVVAASAASAAIKNWLAAPPPMDGIVRLPFSKSLDARNRVDDELRRRRRVNKPPNLSSIFIDLDKEWTAIQHFLEEQLVDPFAIVDKLENDLKATARQLGVPMAAQLDAYQRNELLQKVRLAQGLLDPSDPANPLIAERDAIYRECAQTDQKMTYVMSPDSQIGRFQGLIVGATTFFGLAAPLAALTPDEPAITLGVPLLGSFAAGYFTSSHRGRSISPEAWAAFDTVTSEIRSRIITLFETLEKNEITRRHGLIAEKVLAEWSSRDFARLLQKSTPASLLAIVDAELAGYEPQLFEERDPAEVHFAGRKLAQQLLDHRTVARPQYIKRAHYAFVASTRDEIDQLGPDAYLDRLKAACLEELGGTFSLEEVVAVMMNDSHTASLLGGRLHMVLAAAADTFRHAESSRLDKWRNNGVRQIGYPVFPPPAGFSELVNSKTAKPLFYRSSDSNSLEALFVALNMPPQHSREHQLGEEAIREMKEIAERLWFYPKELR